MKKYCFNEKLEEGIFYSKSGILAFADGRTAYKSVLPHGTIHKNIERNGILPCLARKRISTGGDISYIVEAVSADSPEQKRKVWLCTNPLLFEETIAFFLENNAMAKMFNCHRNCIRNHATTSIRTDFFITDSGTMIDLKVSMAGIDTAYGEKQKMRYPFPVPGSAMRYTNILNIPKFSENRMILLFIQQHGQDFGYPNHFIKRYDSIKAGCAYRLELWTAVMQMDTEGINLISYNAVE